MGVSKTIEEWTKEIRAYVDENFNVWLTWEDLPKALLYLASEVIEVFEGWRDDDRENVAEELADVFIRLLDTAAAIGVDLDAEVRKKMDKNWERERNHGRKKL